MTDRMIAVPERELRMVLDALNELSEEVKELRKFEYAPYFYLKKDIEFRLAETGEDSQSQSVPDGWQPIETAPRTGRKVLLFYLNSNNKSRTVMARWLTDEQAAESDSDGVGLEGGWYECIDNWSDYTEVAIHEGDPTHWMPLPSSPKPNEGEV